MRQYACLANVPDVRINIHAEKSHYLPHDLSMDAGFYPGLMNAEADADSNVTGRSRSRCNESGHSTRGVGNEMSSPKLRG